MLFALTMGIIGGLFCSFISIFAPMVDLKAFLFKLENSEAILAPKFSFIFIHLNTIL